VNPDVAAILAASEQRQAQTASNKTIDDPGEPDAAGLAVQRALDRVRRQADLDRGDVTIEVFEA